MPRHKTAHRKELEARNKRQVELRAAAVAELAAGDSLKPNAVANAKRTVRAAEKAAKK